MVVSCFTEKWFIYEQTNFLKDKKQNIGYFCVTKLL